MICCPIDVYPSTSVIQEAVDLISICKNDFNVGGRYSASLSLKFEKDHVNAWLM